MSDRTLAWSFGGGWQSVAIGVLIRQRRLPQPDLAAIADTSREVGTTRKYLYEHMQPFLDPIGLKIEVVPHTLARVDMYDNTSGLTLMPAYTSTGRLRGFCSGEWKRDVMERWLRLKGVKTCTQWIGYSIDEVGRSQNSSGETKKDHRPWCHIAYPLIEKGISREACAEIIQSAGLPLPNKSRCWCCPHQNKAEWLEIQSRPDEFAAAVALEREINEGDPEQSGLFLYNGRVPLDQANFASDAGVDLPSRPCETGHCWT